MNNKTINKELAGEILHALYWCRQLSVPRKKWRKTIVEKFHKSGTLSKYGTEAFVSTWEGLEEVNLI